MAQGNIAQYNSPIDKLTPEDHGMDALARAGRTEAGLYHQAGEDYQRTIDQVGGQAAKVIDDHEYASEVSQGSAALAAMHNSFTNQWNEMATKSDPNDKSIQGTFLDGTVEPQLQSFQDGFSTERGQQWALGQADQMRMHYTEKTSADMSTRAGSAFIQDLKTQTNQLSSAAHADHTSIDQSLNQMDAYIAAQKEAHASMLTPEALNKIDDVGRDAKNEIVKSGIQGWADKDPKQAVAAVNGGVYDKYVSGTEKDQITKYAEGVTRMKLEDQNLAYVQKERAQKQQEEAATNKLFNDSYNPQTGVFSFGPNTIQQIGSNTSLSAKAKIDMMGAVKKLSSDSSFDDPSTMSSFTQRMSSSSNNPLTQDDLLSALGKGQLTMGAYKFFNDSLKNTDDNKAANEMLSTTMKQWGNNLLGAKSVLGSGYDPANENANTRFQTWFLLAYRQALADPAFAGMTTSQKANALLSPDSPKYMLGPKTMEQFAPTGSDLLKTLQTQEKNAPVVQPHQLTDVQKKAALDSIFGGR